MIRNTVVIALIILSFILSGLNFRYRNKRPDYWGNKLQTQNYWLTPDNSNINNIDKVERFTGYVNEFSVNPENQTIQISLDLINNPLKDNVNITVPNKILKDSIYIINYDEKLFTARTGLALKPEEIKNSLDNSQKLRLGTKTIESITYSEFIEIIDYNLLISVELGSKNIDSKDFNYVYKIAILTNYE